MTQCGNYVIDVGQHSVVPALGYSAEEVRELEATIAAADCDVAVVGTPIDLARIVSMDKPSVRARYHYEDASSPGLHELIRERFSRPTA